MVEPLVNGFDHHDRIIHQHTQRNNGAQQHHHVQALAEYTQRPEGAGENERDTDARQKGYAKSEEQPGDEQHEYQAKQRVVLHHTDRFPGQLGGIVDQCQPDPGDVGGLIPVVDVVVQGFNDLQRVGVRFFEHRQHDRIVTVEIDQPVGFLPATLYNRDLAQADLAECCHHRQ